MNNKKKILFVDDDPKVLQAIRRNVRMMRDEWESEFAQSGKKALEMMEQNPPDLIVSDMRMPGMDGAQLFNEVKNLFPDTIRIILSGQTDEKSLMQAAGSTHQILSKPCEFEALKEVINRACTLRDSLDNPALKRVVSQLQSIPSFPQIYNDVMAELKSPGVTIENVGKIISRDIGMSTKILQLANSAYFGFSSKIGSADHAVQILGLDTIQAMVISYHIFSKIDPSKLKHVSIDQVWDHSMKVSGLAMKIAKAEKMDCKTQYFTFTAGLVHDIGMLIIAQNLPDQFKQALSLAKTDKIKLCDAEAQILNTSHEKVAAYLLGLWGLPDPIVEAVAFHHSLENYPGSGLSPLTFLHVADVFENERNKNLGFPDYCSGLHEDYLKKVGAWERIPQWKEICQNLDQE